MHGGLAVLAFDASKHAGDVAVLPLEGKAALRIIPGKARKEALDRRHRKGSGLVDLPGKSGERLAGMLQWGELRSI